MERKGVTYRKLIQMEFDLEPNAFCCISAASNHHYYHLRPGGRWFPFASSNDTGQRYVDLGRFDSVTFQLRLALERSQHRVTDGPGPG